jgi:hypothetical protein
MSIGRLQTGRPSDERLPQTGLEGGCPVALTVPRAEFRFESGAVAIAAEVARSDFEAWIAPDLLASKPRSTKRSPGSGWSPPRSTACS